MNCGKTSQIAKPKRFEEFGRKKPDFRRKKPDSGGKSRIRAEDFGRTNTDLTREEVVLEGSFALCSFSPWHFEILSELGVGRILEPRADFLRSGGFFD